jgi:hypothetical protein
VCENTVIYVGAPHHHPCSAIAAKRIFSECTGQSFEQILQLPFFDVVHAIESYTDLFSVKAASASARAWH